ncbi:RAB3 GTPase activating protein subunit 1 [Musca autumnalis]|uniref:RAB3 GTPase activating protein subunit 1 n=1 Tax=Musca autumnalis TaxID=221902 RepID=UPI003CE9E7C1
MAEEIDDNGFYREDFSAESDWEVFNAQLCDLFQRWELGNTREWGGAFDVNATKFLIDEEQLEVLGKQMTVKYYKADTSGSSISEDDNKPPFHEDLLCVASSLGQPTFIDEKANEIHYLARMYGLRRFVVMHPTQLQNHYLTKTSKFSFFLSSISVVASEVCSAVPIFLHIHDPKWNFFLGIGMSSYMRTNFHSVALEQAPTEYLYLSGLVKMFKEKLPRNHDKPAVVSVRNTYAMDTIKLRVPMYVPFGMTPVVDEERSVIDVSYFTALPHGYFPGSNTTMFATFTWPELMDNMFIDSPLQTQFIPSKAPCGTLHQNVHANSYLTACLKDYFNLITAKNTLESYVGRNFSGATTMAEVGNPLDQLGKVGGTHRPTVTKQYVDSTTTTSSSSATQNKLPGPMKEYELNPMLYYLFPNIRPDLSLFPYETLSKDKIDPHRIKSAVSDSLVYRLSCLLATTHAHFGGKSGFAQLYAAFTRELRQLWESCTLIPGVASGLPDTRTCLLHQKLQMLNVCIEKRLQREKGITTSKTPQDITVITDDEDDDDEDTDEDFYDLSDNTDDANTGGNEEATNEKSETKSEKEAKLKQHLKAEGRLQRLNNLKLIDGDEYLYVPITQDLAPKTEDQLQDDADVMLKMGSDSEFITDLMCSTVVSDAEAFKAANPRARFEDFIRWFSPNDWEQYLDEETKELRYKLSPRMQAPGNTWQKVWEQAKPVPASKQKRLFDDTQEGYKILNYLESRNLGEIFGLTIVPLLHSSILKLKDIFANSHVLELFNENVDEILADLSRFSRDVEIVEALPSPNTEAPKTHENKYTLQLPNPQPLLKKIEQLERDFYHYKCFECLPGMKDLTAEKLHSKFREILHNNGSCNIVSKTEDENILELSLQTLFKDDMRDKLLSKDYIIRLGEGLIADNNSSTMAKDMEAKEKQPATIMPQFLRAIVTGEKLRLCGAFTENTTFLD